MTANDHEFIIQSYQRLVLYNTWFVRLYEFKASNLQGQVDIKAVGTLGWGSQLNIGHML